MTEQNKPKHAGGRPPAPPDERRKQKQISLHPQTLERLDALAAESNRSAWITAQVDRAWAMKEAGRVLVMLTPKQVEGLRALGFNAEELTEK